MHGLRLGLFCGTRTRPNVNCRSHVFLYNAAVQHAKAAMDAGARGRVYYISMVRTNLGPIRMDVNAAWDLAAYDIAIANYWLGSQPVSVSTTAGTWFNPGAEDTVLRKTHSRPRRRAIVATRRDRSSSA